MLDFARDGKDWPNRSASQFVTAAGLKWHVQIMGEGPEILLVHGTGASTHSFAELAHILANAFTVIVPDLPGHGFTEMPRSERLSLPGMAQDLAGLTEALNVKPALVVGHSAGAAILIEMCLDGYIAPHGIVSINGALLPFGSVVGRFFSPLAKLLVLNPVVPHFFAWRAANPAAVERVLRGTGSQLSREGIKRYGTLFRSETHVAAALGMMAKWDLHALQHRLPSLKTKLILVAGGRDRAVAPDDAFKVKEQVQDAEVVYLRNLGHLAHEERAEEIAEIIVKAGRPAFAAAAP